MLQKSETQNPNAIEEHFCKPLEKFNPTLLNKEQMQLMVVLSLSDESSLPQMVIDFSEAYWFYNAIEPRLSRCFTYTMDTKSKLLLVTWCSSIGEVIMYLTFLQYKCKQKGIKKVTFNILTLMFSTGIIDKNFMHKIWDGQKVQISSSDGSDNLIDYPSALISLKF